MSTTQAERTHARPPHVLTRPALLDILRTELERWGVPWAWQGPDGASATWADSVGPADLDVWCNPPSDRRDELEASLARALGAAVVAHTDDARRLTHTGLAVETADGLAVVDMTVHDLRVGSVLLVPAEQVQLAASAGGPRLAGVAAAADLLVRPLLRGRIPAESRIREAREAWRSATPLERMRVAELWRVDLGRVSQDIVNVLDGDSATASLARRVRRRLLHQTLRPRALASTWRQRETIRPAGRRAGPLGLPTRGVVVALVGTDGSGKSTVSDELRHRLTALGFETRDAYFGMARGNLPGVVAARRWLGVRSALDTAGGSAVEVSASPATLSSARSLDHPTVRQAAAWFYAGEYVWRYLRLVLPGRRRRQVVVCDRYVYDLEQSPWPGSRAATWARAVVPAPDLLVLPDAPADVIHRRKPERSLQEQAAQQEWLRDLLGTRPARVGELIVDTSGASVDPIGSVVVAVVETAHGRRR